MNQSNLKTALAFSVLGIFSVVVFGLIWFFFISAGVPVGLGWYLFSFAAGLSMIVLPCTLPLAFVIVPLSMGKGAGKGLGIALSFGLGVTLMLSAYGVIAALIGDVAIGTLGAPLEVVKNWLYFVAGIFAYLFALGEIGLVRFRMPSYSGAAPAFIQKQSDFIKAFLLGIFLGNVGVGCPHPATPVILTRIAASGDVFYGWLLFFTHAVGRVLPLLLLAFLAILGINALSWLISRKEKVERMTGWAMVFVAAFILVLGLFSHDWWVLSGQHTLLEEITGEEQFLQIIVDRFRFAEPPHTHGIPIGTGLFDLPLWLGNWVLVFLWILPMWWYYLKLKIKNEKVKMTGETEETKTEDRTRQLRFWFFAALTVLLALTFIYALPTRFLIRAGALGGGTTIEDIHNDAMMPDEHRELRSTSTFGNLPLRAPSDRIGRLPYALKDGVKEFRLTADEFRWEYAKGKWVHAWGYNRQIPGPEIRVNEGDRVRVIVKNNLPDATSVHWHGIDVAWRADGVPGVTQDAIAPGKEFIYEFTATPAGTHLYHSHGKDHSTAAQQMDMGLSGAFIIEPKVAFISYDREYTMMLDEWLIGGNGENMALTHEHGSGMMNPPTPRFNTFTINGRLFPDTEPLLVKTGERVLVRLINNGTADFHPMHLHGHTFDIVARDGNPLPPVLRERRNTETIHPGETVDILVRANNPGIWAFHCHQVHHAASGMITVLQYEDFDPKAAGIAKVSDLLSSIVAPLVSQVFAHGDIPESEDIHDEASDVVVLPKPIQTLGSEPLGVPSGKSALSANQKWWALLGVSLAAIAALSWGVRKYLIINE